eukprot:c14821_g1_i2.p1 GENE.c14821_g1_i2~~c14821_g1_i2.p1  ORF type:complete len:672 (+),score=144.84 c14821_g1_i2:42-2057(+)
MSRSDLINEQALQAVVSDLQKYYGRGDLNHLRAKYEATAQESELRVRAVLQEYLDEAALALEMVTNSSTIIRNVHESFQSIHKFAQSSDIDARHFEAVYKLEIANRNLKEMVNTRDTILGVQEQVKDIADGLTAKTAATLLTAHARALRIEIDLERIALDYNRWLITHNKLPQSRSGISTDNKQQQPTRRKDRRGGALLETREFVESVEHLHPMRDVMNSDAWIRATETAYACKTAIMSRVWDVMANVQEVAIEAPELVIAAIRVLEREDNAILARLRHNFPTQLTEGHYKNECLSKFTFGIAAKFERFLPLERTGRKNTVPMPARDFVLFADELIYNLQEIYTNVRPLFPEHYNVFYKHFLIQYHTYMHGRLFGMKEAAEEGLVPPDDILVLRAYLARYYEPFEQFGVPRPEPDVHEIRDALQETYGKQLYRQLLQFVDQIHVNDAATTPETSPEGLITDAHVNVFKLMHRQLVLARDKKLERPLMLEVVSILSQVLAAFAEKQKMRLKNDWERLPLETIIAMINNAHTSELTYIPKLQQDALEMIPPDPEAVVEVPEALNEAGESEDINIPEPKSPLLTLQPFDGVDWAFHEIGKEGYEALANTIMADIAKVIPQFFTDVWHNEGTPIRDTKATFDSYFQDLVDILVESYRRKALQLCGERFLIDYLHR